MPSQKSVDGAREIFPRAVADSAAQLGLKDSAAAVATFRGGDCNQCQILRHNLARRVGEYLSTVDPDLRAVYLYDPDSACDVPQGPHTGPSFSSALNLIVWTHTANAIPADALRALREALDRARAVIACPKSTELCHSLQAAIVGDDQVQARTGYAALINSLWAHPIQVWGQAVG